jgi:hypothetical protein
MKKTTLLATVLLLGASASAIGAATDNKLQGSDTLKDMTKLIITSCTAAAGLDYVGGSSGAGENAMAAGTQEISPMSSTMGAGSCKGGQPAKQAQGLIVAHDGIAIDSESDGATCASGQVASTGGFTVKVGGTGADATGCTGCETGTATYNFKAPPTTTGTNQGWKDVLRIIYSGLLHDGTGLATGTKDCSGDVRKSLLANYSAIFEGGCSALGTCTGGLNHAFRRDDLSGTTDTFIKLVGLPAITTNPFCNGTEQDDKDPIRRACQTVTCTTQADCDTHGGGTCSQAQAGGKVCAGNKDEDDVCNRDNKLGVVLPVFAAPDPDTTAVADGKGDVPTADTYYNMDTCPVSNASKLMDCARTTDSGSGLHFQCPDRPEGDEFNIAGTTVTPTTDAGLPCLCDTAKAKCLSVYTKANTGLTFMDHRVFNLYVRANTTAGKIIINRPPGSATNAKVPFPVGSGNARLFNITSAWFRLKSAKTKPVGDRCALNTSVTACTVTADCGAGAVSEGTTCIGGFCTLPNSDTRNIGCLAAESDCSIGFAGKESATVDSNTVSLKLTKAADGTPIVLSDATALDLTYPLARKLFIASIKGFANVADAKEAGLMGSAAGCYGNLATVQAAATKVSFVPAPFSCYDFNELSTCNNASCTVANVAKDCKAGSTCNASGNCTCAGDADCLGGRTCDLTDPAAGFCKYTANSATVCPF